MVLKCTSSTNHYAFVWNDFSVISVIAWLNKLYKGIHNNSTNIDDRLCFICFVTALHWPHVTRYEHLTLLSAAEAEQRLQCVDASKPAPMLVAHFSVADKHIRLYITSKYMSYIIQIYSFS